MRHDLFLYNSANCVYLCDHREVIVPHICYFLYELGFTP